MQYLSYFSEKVKTTALTKNIIQLQLPPAKYSTQTYLSFEATFQFRKEFQLCIRDDCFPNMHSAQVILDNQMILNAVYLDELQSQCYKNNNKVYEQIAKTSTILELQHPQRLQQLPIRYLQFGADDAQKVRLSFSLKDLFPCFKKCDIIDVKHSLIINFSFGPEEINPYFYKMRNVMYNIFDPAAFDIQWIDDIPDYVSTCINLPFNRNGISTLIAGQLYDVFLHKITVDDEYIKQKNLSVNTITKIFQQKQQKETNTQIYLQNYAAKIKLGMRLTGTPEARLLPQYINDFGYTILDNPLSIEDFKFAIKLNEQQILLANNVDQILRMQQIGKKNISPTQNYVKIYLNNSTQNQKKNSLVIEHDKNNSAVQNAEYVITEYI